MKWLPLYLRQHVDLSSLKFLNGQNPYNFINKYKFISGMEEIEMGLIFPYYARLVQVVISRGGGGFQIITVDYRGGGGAVDYVIKLLIFSL